jgi:prevent-host-death family protein
MLLWEGMTMTITTISSRQFNQDASGAKNASKNGPVIITDRGRPAHVLLTIEEYRRITGGGRKIADLLAMPGIEEVELEIPRRDELVRPADLP